MTFLFGILRSIFDFLVVKPWGLILELIDWIINFVTVDLPGAIWNLLPITVTDYIQSFDFSSLQDVVGPVTWFFPIWAILTIYATAYTFAGIIRLIRFIIGFIPTVEG